MFRDNSVCVHLNFRYRESGRLNLGDRCRNSFLQRGSLTVEMNPGQAIAANRCAIVGTSGEQSIRLVVGNRQFIPQDDIKFVSVHFG